jgi:hypothetical protein
VLDWRLVSIKCVFAPHNLVSVKRLIKYDLKKYTSIILPPSGSKELWVNCEGTNCSGNIPTKDVWNKGIGVAKRRKFSLQQLISQEPEHLWKSKATS